MVSCRFSQQNQSNDTMDYDDIIYPPVSKHDIAKLLKMAIYSWVFPWKMVDLSIVFWYVDQAG